MLAFARFMIFGFVVCTVIYVSLWLYLRARRHGLLIDAWETEGEGQDRETFLDEGHAHYDAIRRRTLVLFVYVLPLATVATIIYMTNW